MDQLYAGAQPGKPERLRRIEQWLDSAHSACWLGRPEVAGLVEEALLHFHGSRYRLLCWVVMPNHLNLVAATRVVPEVR